MKLKKYIAAVSGGPDSMALLNKKRFFIKAVCHVNYHDREDTDNDEIILRSYCQKHNIPIYVFDTRKDDISKYQKFANPQTYYREIRYDFFEEIAKRLNIKKCLIGHNKDDFLESAYMTISKSKKNLFLGIRRKSKYRDIVLIRPLLRKRKKDLERYCIKKHISFAVDYSNFSDIYLRNTIRKKIATFSNKEVKQLYLKAKVNNYLNFFLIRKIERKFLEWKKKKFSIIYFIRMPKQMQTYLIYNFLNSFNVVPNENKITQVCDFLNKNQKNGLKHFRLKQDLFLAINNGKVILINNQVDNNEQ